MGTYRGYYNAECSRLPMPPILPVLLMIVVKLKLLLLLLLLQQLMETGSKCFV